MYRSISLYGGAQLKNEENQISRLTKRPKAENTGKKSKSKNRTEKMSK